jgi:hypothetical protein
MVVDVVVDEPIVTTLDEAFVLLRFNDEPRCVFTVIADPKFKLFVPADGLKAQIFTVPLYRVLVDDPPIFTLVV